VIQQAMPDEARKALERHAWNDAFTLLKQADATGSREYAAAKRRVDLKDIPEPVEIASIDRR
jgi:hypothetical protein